MDNRKQVSTQIYAPNNAGFTHTRKDQFTHFSGSSAGARSTFGMESAELNKAYGRFLTGIEMKLNSATDGALVSLLNQTYRALDLAVANKKTNYSTADDIAKGLIASGHIPILLSAILPAVEYRKAARSISASEVSYYCNKIPGAMRQGAEYLTKQDMMTLIAKLRSDICVLREKTSQDDPLFYACNLAIMTLDEQVIRVNQSTMPGDYEQFDLTETFVAKVHALICELDPTVVDRESIQRFISAVREAGKCVGVNPVEFQQVYSDIVYGMIIDYADKKIGITKDSDLDLTLEQDAKVQAILPLLVYLNARTNPFARNGLFGGLVTNDFHRQALDAYRLHESAEAFCAEESVKKYQPRKPASPVEFDDAQMETLLLGSAPVPVSIASTSFFASMSATLTNLLTDSSASGSRASVSNQRHAQLALPEPARYRAIEAPRSNPQPGAGGGGRR